MKLVKAMSPEELAVGNEPVRSITERVTATGVLRLLSPSDCVKDRLAAYFHWNDRQALQQAVLVASMQRVDLEEVRRWSTAEGAGGKFEEFLLAITALKQKRSIARPAPLTPRSSARSLQPPVPGTARGRPMAYAAATTLFAAARH